MPGGYEKSPDYGGPEPTRWSVWLWVALPLIFAVISAAIALWPSPAPAAISLGGMNYTPIPTYSAACCKVCHKGKACGDTCISRSNTCHVGQGCACDG